MNTECMREYDFALVLDGPTELTPQVEDALFEAGCDDATFSVRYGRLFAEFSRSAPSLKDAILSAIRDIHGAAVGATVFQVDECDLVTQADIARRMGRTRQMVHQYITGQRGPGTFPPPSCHLAEGAPLWPWCEVSQWLAQHDLIRPEEGRDAEAVAAINSRLDAARRERKNPALAKELFELVP
jgi:hypothetical protein